MDHMVTYFGYGDVISFGMFPIYSLSLDIVITGPNEFVELGYHYIQYIIDIVITLGAQIF